MPAHHLSARANPVLSVRRVRGVPAIDHHTAPTLELTYLTSQLVGQLDQRTCRYETLAFDCRPQRIDTHQLTQS
jgi:hypothetical protein